MQREYILEKTSVNKLNPGKMKTQLAQIRKDIEANKTVGGIAKNKGRLKPEVFTGEGGKDNYRYSVKLLVNVSKEGQRAEEELDLLEKVARKSADLQKWHVVGEAAAVAIAGGLFEGERDRAGCNE